MSVANAAFRLQLLLSTLALGALALAWESLAPLLLAGLYLLLLVMARRQAWLGVERLEIARSLPAGAFEGDDVTVRLELANLGRRSLRHITVRDEFGASPASTRSVPHPQPLPGRSLKRLGYRASCGRLWGIYPVGPLSLELVDELGLFRAQRQQQQIATLSVFPRVLALPGLPSLGARPSLSLQDTTSGRRGQSALYMGVREYVPGDDPRRIHWRASARRGALMTREHELDLVPYFTLFLDLDQRHRTGLGRASTLEYVVRCAASLLAQAARSGHWVQLMGDASQPLRVPPGRGEQHLTLALGELIKLRQDGDTPLATLVTHNLGALPSGSLAVLLSSTTTPSLEELERLLMRLAARRVRPALVFVNEHSFTAIERRPLPPERVAEWQRRLGRLLEAHAVPYALLGLDEPLEERLAQGLFR